MTLEQLKHFSGKARALVSITVPLPYSLDKRMFVRPLAQGREFDAQAADPIIKILAKKPRLDLIAQASVGG